MKKGVAWVYEFPIFDNDGDPVLAAAPTCYVAKDGADYVETDNSAVEKLFPDTGGTGTYKVQLTATEMNCGYFAVAVTTEATDAKQTPAFFETEAYTVTELYNAITGITSVGGFTISAVAGDAVASVFDLIIEQGATYSRSFVWKDADGALVDITSWSFRMQIRLKPASDLLASSDAGDAVPLIVITKDAPYASGKITITINSEDTALLDFLHGAYDIEAYDTSDPPVVYRLFQGCVDLSKEITLV